MKTYKEAATAIRNVIRKLDPENFIFLISKYANYAINDRIENLKRAPWLSCMLMEWVLRDNVFWQGYKRTPTEDDVHHVLQASYDLQNLCGPEKFDPVFLFFRAMSHQQFVYQRGLSSNSVLRNLLIFSVENSEDGSWADRFHRSFGLSMTDFCYGGINSWLVMTKNEMGVLPRHAQMYKTAFIGDLCLKVGDLLSIRHDRFRIDMPVNEDLYRQEKYYHQPIFREVPFIRIGNDLLTPHISVMACAIEDSMYRLMMKVDGADFGVKFGKLVERYCEGILEESGVDFILESDLKRIHGGNISCVDFLIFENDCEIYVDCKTKAMNSADMAIFRGERLLQRFRETTLKAVGQAQKTHEIVGSEKKIKFVIAIHSNEQYLGGGRTMRNLIGQTFETEFSRHTNCVDPENVFVMSIDDFERVLWARKQGVSTIREVLERVKLADSNPETQKFIFEQHLASQKLAESGFQNLIAEKRKLTS